MDAMAKAKTKKPRPRPLKNQGKKTDRRAKAVDPKRGNNAKDYRPYVFALILASLLAAAAALYVASVASSKEKPRPIQNRTTANAAFLKWFVDNGGKLHVDFTIEAFPSYGGWGLALPVPKDPTEPSAECRPEGADALCSLQDEKSAIVRHMDPLFTVPSSIIISVQSILDTYSSPSSSLFLHDFYPKVNEILTKSFPSGPGLARRGMGLVEQDAVIAMHLMVEECQHRHAHLFEGDSRWAPYLDVLPQHLIPRLDTFGDEEYAALKDENLERVGRNSRSSLARMFSSGGGEGARVAPSLEAVVRDMIRKKIGPASSLDTIPESCVGFDAFHRFVAIVSSRAMVLQGVKHLTPLAEMINYAPKAKDDADGHVSFDLYHNLAKDNSITVRSDRDIFLPGGDGKTSQVFEDYGPVDNSLFLEAHGFVPGSNPNNCANLSGSHLFRRAVAAGRFDENVDLLLRALKALHLVHPKEEEFKGLGDVCVKDNLVIVYDGDTVGRKPASDSIAVASLLLGDHSNEVWIRIEDKYGERLASLRDKCQRAIRSNDAQRVEIFCARYPGNGSIVKQALRTAAGRAVASFEDNGHSEEKLISSIRNADSLGKDKLVLALQFRLQELRILHRIEQSADEFIHRKNGFDGVLKSSVYSDELEEKLTAFRHFVQSLDLALNKIEPRLVEDGMRIGAFATENLEADDAYISLSSDSVIDVASALADAKNDTKISYLLRKYASKSQDGFDALLIYLLHERFQRKDRSRWWPYLNLLPSIEELSYFHPLFFQEDEIDRYLAGSDVRSFILGYQRRAAERYTSLSSDLDANLVVGSDIMQDKGKVYWATAVLDSRSIWWGGKRHLSPLLDLVNADSEGRAHETKLEDSEDAKRKMAVTRASRRVEKGDQVFENYAQPNHLLFTYHGFLLEDNANDCALLEGLFIHRDDPGAKSARLLQTSTPTFCIREKDSVEKLAQFLRIKHDLAAGPSSSSAIDNVRPFLIQIFEDRIARLTEATGSKLDASEASLPRLNSMRKMVENDLMHFEHALKTHVLVEGAA